MRVRLSILVAGIALLTAAVLAHASAFVSIYTIAGPSQVQGPAGLAAAGDGTVYVADTINQRIRKIAWSGGITTIAGTGDNGFSGDGGPARQAKFEDPTALALGSDGSLYVADTGNNRIRVIRPTGKVETVAGTADQGFSGDGGPATAAQLNAPAGLAVDSQGRVFFSDTGNNRVRVIGTDGRIGTVLAGPLKAPTGLAFGPGGTLLIADTGNGMVRQLSSSGQLTTVASGLRMPVDVAATADGRIYVADQRANRILQVDSQHAQSNFAGTGDPRFGGDGKAAASAYVNAPHAIELLPSGQELLIADSDNDRVRYVGSTDHVTRLAIAAPATSVTAPLVKKKVVVNKRKRRILVVRDVPIRLRLTLGAHLTITIRTKKGRFVTELRHAGRQDLTTVHLPQRLRSGKHRLKKDHYVLGVTAKFGNLTASTNLELVVK